MNSKKFIPYFIIFVCLTSSLSGCGLVIGLFYNDWHSETAYRSSSSKSNYYTIKGITQSHCGCSDVVVESYKKKKTEFKFYYGGGLFPAKKYVYQYNKNKIDTLVFIPVETDKFDIQLDSLDKVILKQIDTLVTTRPKGSGLIYKVKQHNYKGYVREK